MKKFFSALGIGVIVVAMLSLIVSPVLAGSASYQRGTEGLYWGIYAKVSGEWNDANPTTFTTSNAWSEVWGSTVTQSYYVYGPGLSTVYSEVTARMWLGSTIHAWAWISPPAYPLTCGGDWEFW